MVCSTISRLGVLICHTSANSLTLTLRRNLLADVEVLFVEDCSIWEIDRVQEFVSGIQCVLNTFFRYRLVTKAVFALVKIARTKAFCRCYKSSVV